MLLSFAISPSMLNNAVPSKAVPSKAELLSCLPSELLELNPHKAWCSLGGSLSLSLLAYGVGNPD